jgi:hypothetical protein
MGFRELFRDVLPGPSGKPVSSRGVPQKVHSLNEDVDLLEGPDHILCKFTPRWGDVRLYTDMVWGHSARLSFRLNVATTSSQLFPWSLTVSLVLRKGLPRVARAPLGTTAYRACRACAVMRAPWHIAVAQFSRSMFWNVWMLNSHADTLLE